jgi:hypothetical protein
MLLRLIQSVASCLDRESARKLVKLHIETDLGMIWKGLEEKDRHPNSDARMEFIMLIHAQNFVTALQREARAILRRPAASKSSLERT